MICPRPECPLEFRIRAMEAYKREHPAHWASTNTTTETCTLCARNRTWETRYPSGDTREIEVGLEHE